MARAKSTRKTSSKKSTSSRKKQNISLRERIENFRNDDKARLFTAVFIFFFSIFMIISFFSYLVTWKQDQNILEHNWFMFIFQTDVPVANAMGKMGALLSGIFINDWFGVAAIGFVFMFVLLGFKLINFNILPLRKTFKYTAFSILWLSITLSFLFGNTDFAYGGGIGFKINEWMGSFLGKIGEGLILLIALFAFFIFTIEGSLQKISVAFNKLFDSLKINKRINLAKAVSSENTEEAVLKDKSHFYDKEEDLEFGNDKNIVIDLDTNEPLQTVNRREFMLDDKGEEKDIKKKADAGLGFEIENTKAEETTNSEENENTGISLSGLETVNTQNSDTENTQLDPNGLALAVEKNSDIIVDGISNELSDYDPTLDLSNFKFPSVELLEDHKASNSEVTNEELISNKNKIVETLKSYKIEITKIKATIGPTITLYEIIPAPGVRISKIKNLEDDIALSLAALGIRIIAPMPGRGTIGIEVPNLKPEIVSMRSVISSAKFQESKMELPLALGKTISNESYVVDLAKMPHLLVAGATGQGKSVGLNAIIASLLYKKHPAQVKFVLIDPKKVELTLYEKIERHYLAALPDADECIITDNQAVIRTVSSLNVEMDNRYTILKKARVRNIKEYNAKFISRKLNPNNGHKYLPYIVLVIDEFADLIMTAGKEIELPIARIAQLARAVGIHLIVATQRPSTNIITGVIKANFPARMAFKVASMIDSRTILDSPGANHLIGRGDMLITQGGDLIRVQCAFIDTPELDLITDHIGEQQGYPMPFLLPEPPTEDGSDVPGAVDLSKTDDLFEDAARIVVIHQQGSTSLIQRKLAIGYNRAGRIVDQLEAAGIVGAFKGSKAREVLYSDEYSLEQCLNGIKNK